MAKKPGRAFPQHLRDQVLAAVDSGTPAREAAIIHGVSREYVYKILKRRRETGETSANPNRGRHPFRLTLAQQAALAAHLRANPHLSAAQCQVWLMAEYGVWVCNSTVNDAARRMGVPFRKKKTQEIE